ncbi:MAG: allophanate hydrolase [Caulobacteraceae bacterium]|nr:allophanate hydrolase [Caulobacteraceae bacterium]
MAGNERLSVAAIAAEVRGGRRLAVDVAAEVLARRDAYDAVQPQAWIQRGDAAAVLQAARRIDLRIAAGEDLPLAGVPYAVKDNIDVAGLPTTAGCPAFAYAPERSATVVDRLEAAGALLIGKTNLDQFATGLVGTRSPYGAPACVYNLELISGGSSSGSAVVTAAGVTAFALGTDTAGSGRVPAAINHLVGLKPTKGRFSTRGLAPACRSLDCITVFASTVADAALVDGVVAGFDPGDPYSRDDVAGLDTGSATRIGVPLPSQRNFLGDRQSQALFEAALRRMHRLGVELVEVDIAPLLAAAQLLYAGPWVAERAAAVEGLLRSDPAAIHPVVRAILEQGLAVTGIEVFRGQYRLKGFEAAAAALWATVDVLMLPTAPTTYRIRELEASPVALNSNLGLYTNFVNLLDMSAIALPAGFRDNGSGFGVTFIGPAFADIVLQRLAQQFEDTADMTAPALDLKDRPPETVKLAVVGAHLEGMPLHWQLTSRDARLVTKTRTAPAYRLYAMADTVPPKPALVHVGEGGAAIALEVYELPMALFGGFVAEVPAPLAIGTVTLEDGSQVKGFVAEPRATAGAEDVTHLGGWRAYIAGRA